MKRRLIPLLLLSGLTLAGTANAGDDSRHGHGRGDRDAHPASVERLAMQNLLAASLAQSTGRDAAEIGTLLAKSRPPEVAEQLGIDRDAMREAMKTARTTLIERYLAAGLITAEQAETLKAASPPPGRRPPR